jgi:hypothetical protein
MGNLDFAQHAAFSWYCLLLMFSGIVMLVISVLRNQSTQRRVIRAILGIGFFGYGFYLAFVFGGGSYIVFFQAFIVPVLLIVDTFRSQTARRKQPQPPLNVGMSSMAGPGLQPMTGPGLQPMADPGLQPMPGPGLQPMADPGLQPMADPGLQPMADPGLPPMPPS